MYTTDGWTIWTFSRLWLLMEKCIGIITFFYLMIICAFCEMQSHFFWGIGFLARSWIPLLYSIDAKLISTCKQPCIMDTMILPKVVTIIWLLYRNYHCVIGCRIGKFILAFLYGIVVKLKWYIHGVAILPVSMREMVGAAGWWVLKQYFICSEYTNRGHNVVRGLLAKDITHNGVSLDTKIPNN